MLLRPLAVALLSVADDIDYAHEEADLSDLVLAHSKTRSMIPEHPGASYAVAVKAA